jgi:hypothetical protein
MLRSREFATSFLLQAAWFEAAHFGGVRPMQMVAQCIGNRVRAGWGDWHQVLSNLGKYSAVDPIIRGGRWLAAALPGPNDPRFQAMLPLMDQVYDNSGDRLAGEAVLWADVREITHTWFLAATNPETGSFERSGGSAQLVLWKARP